MPCIPLGRHSFAVRDQNVQALAELAQYPLYLGIESGNEIDSKDELMRKYTAEQIFTEEFTNSVLHCDLLNLREAGGNRGRLCGRRKAQFDFHQDGRGLSAQRD